jgi:hypothetical protein
VPKLDKSSAYAISLVRPHPISVLHDWLMMELSFINLNKGKDDEGYIKFCNILKWSAAV